MYYILGVLIDFGLAWRLLTVIPLLFVPTDVHRPAGWAAAYYPLIGLVLGTLLAGADWLLDGLLPAGVAAALLVALWAGLTGLLHLDGLMDACDGLLPPREMARRLEIMKDSRVGAFGVVGVVLLLLLKFNALATLPPMQRLPALLISPTLGRWAMTWAMAYYPLARGEGAAVFFSQGLGRAQVVMASIGAAAVTLFLMGWPGLFLLGAAWLILAGLARLAMARIGGLTGDVYGAICEITEVVLLVMIGLIR